MSKSMSFNPIVALFLCLAVTLPVAAWLSTDFLSAYMFTGMAVCLSAGITLLALVRAGRKDREEPR